MKSYRQTSFAGRFAQDDKLAYALPDELQQAAARFQAEKRAREIQQEATDNLAAFHEAQDRKQAGFLLLCAAVVFGGVFTYHLIAVLL